MELAEYESRVDKLRMFKESMIQAKAEEYRYAIESYTKALESIHFKYWEAVNLLTDELDPSLKTEAIRYANGDSSVHPIAKEELSGE